MRAILFALAGATALAGCASQPSAPRVAAATPIPVAGAKVEDCVSLSNIRESRVIDDKTIDFIMRDGRTLRNTMPYGCPGLGFDKAFTYKTSISQLCSVDIITVITQGGGVRMGASCGLGKFVPVTPVK